MKIRLDYGKSGLDAELPDANLVSVLKLKPAPTIPNPPEAAAHAITGSLCQRQKSFEAGPDRGALAAKHDVGRCDRRLSAPAGAAPTSALLPDECAISRYSQ